MALWDLDLCLVLREKYTISCKRTLRFLTQTLKNNHTMLKTVYDLARNVKTTITLPHMHPMTFARHVAVTICAQNIHNKYANVSDHVN